MHLRISTKHGRHGQGVTLKKWLNFDVYLNPDVALGSHFHLPWHYQIRHDTIYADLRSLP